jgi:hypothetical protein
MAVRCAMLIANVNVNELYLLDDGSDTPPLVVVIGVTKPAGDFFSCYGFEPRIHVELVETGAQFSVFPWHLESILT